MLEGASVPPLEGGHILAYITWRPTARAHVLKSASENIEGEYHRYETLCGKTDKTAQTCALPVGGDFHGYMSVDQILTEAAYVCTRCMAKFREMISRPGT